MCSRRNNYLALCLGELVLIVVLAWYLGLRFTSNQQASPLPHETVVQVPALTEATGTMLFVGDMMFDRSIARIINERQDPRTPFEHIASWLRSADVAVGNLEGPISDAGQRQGSIYSFRFAPTSTLEALRFAGFDILTLANNHIWDYGRRAALDTLALLRGASIDAVGFGHNEDEANAPVIKKVAGATVAFLGFTDFYGESARATLTSPGLSFLEETKIREQVRATRLRGDIDLIVVSLHWGEEYKTQANERQRRFARELIDDGADLIVGHHPHVAQEVESYTVPSMSGHPGRTGWVAYSLGNFIFDQNFSPDTRHGVILRVTIYQDKTMAVEPLKVRFSTEYQPYLVDLMF